jgi:5'-3' exonuclease
MKLVLVDASYNSFYRFFATLRWFQFAKKELYEKEIKNNPNYDFTLNKEFIDKYSKMYLDAIEKQIKKMNDSYLIFCQDVKQNTLWRHKLIKESEVEEKSEYKGERPDLASKYNLEPLFNYTYQILLKNLKKEKPYLIEILKFKSTEADDIIAVISQELEKKKPEQEIIIVSGDDDFTQLLRENVSILDFRTKSFKTGKKEDSEDKLKLKIIMGDKSDNIPSIFPKSRSEVSLKTRKLVKESSEELQKFLKENKTAKIQYQLNEKLIDFTKIPSEIRNPIKEIIPDLIKKLNN